MISEWDTLKNVEPAMNRTVNNNRDAIWGSLFSANQGGLNQSLHSKNTRFGECYTCETKTGVVRNFST